MPRLLTFLLVFTSFLAAQDPSLQLFVGSEYDGSSLTWLSAPNALEPLEPKDTVAFRVHKQPGWWVVLVFRMYVAPGFPDPEGLQGEMIMNYDMGDGLYQLQPDDFSGFERTATSNNQLILSADRIEALCRSNTWFENEDNVKSWAQFIPTPGETGTPSEAAEHVWIGKPDWYGNFGGTFSTVWEDPQDQPFNATTDSFSLGGLMESAIKIQTEGAQHCVPADEFKTGVEEGWIWIDVQPIAFRSSTTQGLIVGTSAQGTSGIIDGTGPNAPQIDIGPWTPIRPPQLRATRCFNVENPFVGNFGDLVPVDVFSLTDNSTIEFDLDTGGVAVKPLIKIGANLGLTRIPYGAVSGPVRVTNAFGTTDGANPRTPFVFTLQ